MRNARHRAREIALQILYRYDEDWLKKQVPTPVALAHEIQSHLKHFQVAAELWPFAARLAQGAIDHREEIDTAVTATSENWRLERMAPIDRNLIRMAVFELLIDRETPFQIVIDEAVELAKEFGAENSPAFVNGLLDALRKKSVPVAES
ncbi:MAG: transcription antitermination factor NusB [Bdellovibrionota bacterium]